MSAPTFGVREDVYVALKMRAMKAASRIAELELELKRAALAQDEARTRIETETRT